MSSAFAAFLRCDNDHAVGCFRTVNGCCRSIAQHIDALNVVGRDEREVDTRHAVYNIIRLHGFAGAQGRRTSKRDRRFTVGIGSRGDHEPGHLALQHLAGRGDDTEVEVFLLERRDGACHILTPHRAVSYDHDLTERFVVLFQYDLLALRGI